MNFGEIKKLVVAEYDSRGLKSNQRYRALDDFENVLKHYLIDLWNDVSKFPVDKDRMKAVYGRKFLNKDLNDGESSMINEVYNQLSAQNIILTDYSNK